MTERNENTTPGAQNEAAPETTEPDQGVLFGFTDDEITSLEEPHEVEDDEQLDDEELEAIHAQLEAASEHTTTPTAEDRDQKGGDENAASTENKKDKSQEDTEEHEKTEADQLREQARQERLKKRRERMSGAVGSPAGPSPASPFSTPFGAAGGRPGAHLDPRIAAQEAKPGPPAWLGTRWREIEPDQQREAWVGLRRWVDWFTDEYKLPPQTVPACWYRHTQLVAELYAAMSMEYKAWDEGVPSMSPMTMWHQSLQSLILRLREHTNELGSCGKGTHRPDDTQVRDYDEDDWRKIAYGRRETKTVTRPGNGEDGYLIRATVTGPESTKLAESEAPVGISPIKGTTAHQVNLVLDRTTAATDSIITLHAEAVPDAQEVIWEKAEEWTANEGGTINADWEIYQEPEEREEENEDLDSSDEGEDSEPDEPAGDTTDRDRQTAESVGSRA